MSLRRSAIVAVWAVALLPLAFLVPALLDGYVLTGSTGLFPLDQLQYMALSREAGHLHHVLDHFPLFFVTGLLTRVGVDVRVGFLLWVPVSAVALVVGFDRYVRALVPAGVARVAALVLALFYASPIVALVWWTLHPAGLFSDLVFTTYYFFPAGAVWGYPQIALALGLMPICFLAVTDERSSLWTAPLAGAFVSFLHPWQGVTVLVVHAIAALWCRSLRNVRMLAAMIGTGAPLAYYRVVEQTDPRFVLTDANTQAGTARAWVLVAVMAPLALAVVGTARGSLASPRDRQLVVWPLVALFAYAFVDASWTPYFLLGTTLPLAILSVRGALVLRPALTPRVAGVLVALLTLPGAVFLANLLRQREVRDAKAVYVLRSSEARALDYVQGSPRSGSVLTEGVLAPEAWALTGRRAWAASALVSPEFWIGGAEAKALIRGRMSRRVARHFTARTHATFIVSGCTTRGVDLRRWLGPMIVGQQAFGCATVYELRNG